MGQSMRFAVVLAAMLVPATALAQESTSFEIKGLSITTLGDPPAASTSYRSMIVADVAHGPSGVCPAGISSTLGFWSVLGAQDVPVVLFAARSVAEPDGIDMTWSGQATGFTVYRSASPVGLVAVGNVLQTTEDCNTSDPNADQASLFFYRVVPDGQ